MDQTKQQILSELDCRISRLQKHANENRPGAQSDNPYGRVNEAMSHVIGEALTKELTDLRGYVDTL